MEEPAGAAVLAAAEDPAAAALAAAPAARIRTLNPTLQLTTTLATRLTRM
jgi:hypothetical protein